MCEGCDGHATRALSAHIAHMTTEQWISKEEAGVRLGSKQRPLSPRRVLELAKAGRLQSELVRDYNTGQMTTRINAGSVERFIYQRDNPPDPTPRPRAHNVAMGDTVNGLGVKGAIGPECDPGGHAKVSEESEPRASRGMIPVPPGLAKRLTQALAGYAEDAIAPPARLWLTLKEATDYAGLPQDVIEGCIGKGEIKAMFIGKNRRGGPWRIRKTDLEAFAG